MFKYSRTSLARLASCDPIIVSIMEAAILVSPVDISIVCGSRSKDDQDLAYALGNSTKKYPDSMHNKSPSLAVDIAPYYKGEIPWEDTKLFYLIAGIVLGYSNLLRWGGAWDGTLNTKRQLADLGHFELRR